MNCRQTQHLLSDYLEGVLKAREQDAISTHLRDCPACRRLRDDLRALEERVRAVIQGECGPFLRPRQAVLERWLATRHAPAARWRGGLLASPTAPSVRWSVPGMAALALLASLLIPTHWQRDGKNTIPRPLLLQRPSDERTLPRSAHRPRPSRRESKRHSGSGKLSPTVEPGGLSLQRPPVHGAAVATWSRDRQPPFPAPRLWPPRTDDLAVLNYDPEETTRQWAPLPRDEWDQIEARVRSTVRVRDDFVTIPFPRLASASDHQIAQAVESYKQQAAIVDPRLAREVSCAFKATALSDLCDWLTTQTGIELSAGPGVADEKVTVFLKEQPLRGLMRQLSHTFGYTWLRTRSVSGVRSPVLGKEADPNTQHRTPDTEYRYELVQDLKSQLLEEELRNGDLHAAMLALNEQMASFQPYLHLNRQELEARWAGASAAEKDLLRKLGIGAQGVKGWGSVQMYYRLSPAQRLALMNGERLEFSLHAPQPDQRLSPEWRLPLLQNYPTMTFSRYAGTRTAGSLTGRYPPETPLAQIPEAMPAVSLRIDRSEVGQLALMVGDGAYFGTDPPEAGVGEYVDPLVVGQSPSATKPDNAAANRSLRDQPSFRHLVSFRPKPSCPRFAAGVTRPDERSSGEVRELNSLGQLRPEPPHVSSADVWEAIHRATGLNIVADSYSHFYPVPPVTVDRVPLFDGLCQVADALGVRWKKEGEFLLCRSASYFWDRQKEVPNRLLVRWQQDSRQRHGLPLEDLLEMAALSDQQLGSATVGKVIMHCWGLGEWGLVGHGIDRIPFGPGTFRSAARLLAGLTPAQRRQAQSPGWLAFADLPPAQQQAMTRFLLLEGFLRDDAPPGPIGQQALMPLLLLDRQTQSTLQNLRFHFQYVPTGPYVWHIRVDQERLVKEAERWPLVVDPTREGALAAVRRLYPAARPDDIRPSAGVLRLTFTQADGAFLFDYGREPVGWTEPD